MAPYNGARSRSTTNSQLSSGDSLGKMFPNKQVEGSKLAEGPIVEEITTDGVVLNYNGTSFVLPRD